MVMVFIRVLVGELKDADGFERYLDRVSRVGLMIGYEGEGRNRNEG